LLRFWENFNLSFLSIWSKSWICSRKLPLLYGSFLYLTLSTIFYLCLSSFLRLF
jgi:hypothetical protein